MSAVITPAHTPAYVTPNSGNAEAPADVNEALARFGLDWTVTKRPLMVPASWDVDGKPAGGFVEVPGRFEVRRDDNNSPVGVVGKTWHPTQNIQGLQIIDDVRQLAGANGTPTEIETGIEFDRGCKVLIMVRIDAGLQIAGEEYRSYMSFMNGHDGRTSVTMFTHDSRFVCANGQVGGLVDARNSGYIVRVRHTKNAGERIKEAIHMLGLRNKQLEAIALEGEHMAEKQVTDAEVDRFLASLFPVGDNTTAPHVTMAEKRRDEVRDVYMTATNLDTIRGTRWGLLQAVAEHADHGRKFTNTETQAKAQLGITRPTLKFDALTILRDKKLRPVKELVAA